MNTLSGKNAAKGCTLSCSRSRIALRSPVSRLGILLIWLLIWAFSAAAGASADGIPRAASEPSALAGDTSPGGAAADDTAKAVDSSSGSPASDETFLGPFRLSGIFDQRYRYRGTSAHTDQDVYGYLSLDATYPTDSETGYRPYQNLNFHLDLNYNLDIDSFQSPRGSTQSSFFPFADITNTFGGRLLVFLQSAYVEVDQLSLFEKIRAGRQLLHREEGLLFDGGYVRTKRWKKLSLDFYGGLPTHLYEDSARGDALGGAGLAYEPFGGLDLGADYFYLKDARDGLPDAENHFSILKATYRPNAEWRFRGSASWTDTRDRRQLFEVSYLSQDIGLLAYLRLVRQNAVVDFDSSEISPFVLVQGSYAAHYQAQLDLHQPIGDNFGAGAGVILRQLENPDDAGIFNHSFGNYYLSLDARELWSGMKASVRGDIWDANDEDIYTVGFELDQELLDIVRVRLGTSYSLYRLDLFTGEERHRDRVYYARLRWHLLRRLDLDTDYRYERDSITEYHTVTVGMRLWF